MEHAVLIHEEDKACGIPLLNILFLGFQVIYGVEDPRRSEYPRLMTDYSAEFNAITLQ